MGKFVVDWTKVNDLEAEKETANTELKDYEHDFKILTDEGLKLAQIAVISENSSYLLECLNSSINTIEIYGTIDEFTGFNQLFDFDDYKSTGSLGKAFGQANKDFHDELMTFGKDIDEKKREVGKKINDLTNKIFILQDEIDWEKNNPSIWVED